METHVAYLERHVRTPRETCQGCGDPLHWDGAHLCMACFDLQFYRGYRRTTQYAQQYGLLGVGREGNGLGDVGGREPLGTTTTHRRQRLRQADAVQRAA